MKDYAHSRSEIAIKFWHAKAPYGKNPGCVNRPLEFRIYKIMYVLKCKDDNFDYECVGYLPEEKYFKYTKNDKAEWLSKIEKIPDTISDDSIKEIGKVFFKFNLKISRN